MEIHNIRFIERTNRKTDVRGIIAWTFLFLIVMFFVPGEW